MPSFSCIWWHFVFPCATLHTEAYNSHWFSLKTHKGNVKAQGKKKKKQSPKHPEQQQKNPNQKTVTSAIATFLTFNQFWGHSQQHSLNHSAPVSEWKHLWVIAEVLIQASSALGWNPWCNWENRSSACREDSSFPLECFRGSFNIPFVVLH